ncbi:MAG TPA: hypothetical protein VN512_13170 [Clostridia bacterium]|nr:hypothetical protein [Clostridia bacterium]
MQLGRDPQTIEDYADRMTTYANDAILDLADACKPIRTDVVAAVNGTINLSALPRTCLKILGVFGDKEIEFRTSNFNTIAIMGADGTYSVTYRYAPKPLCGQTDVPEIPENLHGLITTYVIARERSATDAGNQRGANVYFEIYNAGKRAIRPHYGEKDAYTIKNRW